MQLVVELDDGGIEGAEALIRTPFRFRTSSKSNPITGLRSTPCIKW